MQARAIQARLDAVLGGQNWFDCYTVGPAGGVICSLTLRIGGEWITKQGMAENTQIEAVKGGESESFKRAAYKWGIGRYLYEMPEAWCEATVKGREVVLNECPALPDWAYPSDAQVLELSPTVGLQLLKVIAGRAEGSATSFTPNTSAEKSAKLAAIYILDHLRAEKAAS